MKTLEITLQFEDDFIQSGAESVLRRKLTDSELKKLKKEGRNPLNAVEEQIAILEAIIKELFGN